MVEKKEAGVKGQGNLVDEKEPVVAETTEGTATNPYGKTWELEREGTTVAVQKAGDKMIEIAGELESLQGEVGIDTGKEVRDLWRGIENMRKKLAKRLIAIGKPEVKHNEQIARLEKAKTASIDRKQTRLDELKARQATLSKKIQKATDEIKDGDKKESEGDEE